METKILNIFVCGKFHYHKYVQSIYEIGTLNKIFFSHKINQTLELTDKNSYRNLYLKEYLLNAHLRIFGNFGLNIIMPIYHNIWLKQVQSKLDVAKVNLFLAHGNCLELMQECKNKGGIIIAEVVNAHPQVLDKILTEEYIHLNLPYRMRNYIDERIIKEVNLADIVLAPSKSVAESYISKGIPESKIKIINYGCFPNKGKELSLATRSKNDQNHTFKILCVAKISPRKGQIHLLKAIKHIKQHNQNIKIEITLVGSKDKDYFKKITELNVKFNYISHIENKNMSTFMADYDLFVLPSLEDGFAVVVGEALSAGIPVIVTSATGSSDIIEKINPKLVVPPGNFEELAKIILNVIRNEIVYKPVYIEGWSEYAHQLNEEILILNFNIA